MNGWRGSLGAAALVLAAGLACLLAGSRDVALAHDPSLGGGGATSTTGRYQLAQFWSTREVQVLDRHTGRLFVLSTDKGEAYLVDPLGGGLVTRSLQVVETRPIALAGGAPRWPLRDTNPGLPRFFHVGQRNRGTLEQGGSPSIFDSYSGRVYVVESPSLLVILDPVEGKVTRQHLQASDPVGLVQRVARARNERAAVGTLRSLALAQRVFFERDADGDGEQDFGTLAELAKAGLVDAELGEGRKAGYRFTVRASARTWMGAASPLQPGKTGVLHYAITARGVYSAKAPIPLNEAGRVPQTAKCLTPH